MKKIGIFIVIAVTIFSLVGCNKDLIDTNYTYTKAITTIGNEKVEIEIKQWRDYDGEQIQIVGKDGSVYLLSMNNTALINEKVRPGD